MIKDDSLPKPALHVIREKGTELPYSGVYTKYSQLGTYLCRACGQALFRSHSKFHSSCGWPSFDEALGETVTEVLDADGRRMEILCTNCQAHLGHVFDGEGYTQTNRRFCVNSLSIDFVPDLKIKTAEEAIVAGGCFWGVQALLNTFPGVLKTEVGYTGGHQISPGYEQVCSGLSGHYEAVRILFDPELSDYESVLRYFFEIHDPTQSAGQGPDRGPQYQSVVFYYNEEQKKIAKQLMQQLELKGFKVATKLLPVSVFWPAEDYHQDYYSKTGKTPYCHRHTKRFD